MELESGFERKQIECPTDPLARTLLMEIQPGWSVEEGTLRLLIRKR
jgi:hypothetical protein